MGSSADFLFETKKVLFSNSSLAEVIYFEVTAEFTLRINPDTRNSVPCSSNYFEVYIHRGKDRPEMNVETAETDLRSHFSSFYNITANNSLLSKTPRRQKQIITLDLNKANGVTFAVRSGGACGKISNMKIYYYYCKEMFVNGARLKKLHRLGVDQNAS